MQIYELTSAPIVKEAGKLAAFADALQQHNAYQAGLGFLVDKEGPEVEINHVTGEITIGGQKYDPTDPRHIKALRNYSMHNNLQQPNSQAPAPATAQQPARPASTPAAAQQPSDVGQALVSLGYSPQQSAAMTAKVPPGTNTQAAIKLALAGKLNESLSWSRSFDPSRTLLKKIKQP